ncbi:MAG: hypothetical protein ABI765_06900 [Gemmatimonadota bacterium]
MHTHRYKGFTIQSRPYQIRPSGRWTVDLEISRRGRERAFGLLEHCRSERESDARSFEVGRRIIDGAIPGWSVDGLRRAQRVDQVETAFDQLRRHAIVGFMVLAATAVAALLTQA